ncbi:hypothetical protein PTUN_a1614 [Pseudoalteromonas tunicata]|nr:hypothetical protein PTUN_a1614 [Pseudoalteromonas tunicata]
MLFYIRIQRKISDRIITKTDPVATPLTHVSLMFNFFIYINRIDLT